MMGYVSTLMRIQSAFERLGFVLLTMTRPGELGFDLPRRNIEGRPSGGSGGRPGVRKRANCFGARRLRWHQLDESPSLGCDTSGARQWSDHPAGPRKLPRRR